MVSVRFQFCNFFKGIPGKKLLFSREHIIPAFRSVLAKIENQVLGSRMLSFLWFFPFVVLCSTVLL